LTASPKEIFEEFVVPFHKVGPVTHGQYCTYKLLEYLLKMKQHGTTKKDLWRQLDFPSDQVDRALNRLKERNIIEETTHFLTNNEPMFSLSPDFLQKIKDGQREEST
jgi:hypothetical protein